VRIQLSTPRHLKCQIPRQTKPGFFIFECGSQEVRLWHKADIEELPASVRIGVRTDIKI
jgi:hypothetical protein